MAPPIKVPPRTLESIKGTIESELCKRGFHAELVEFWFDEDKSIFVVRSADFQTVPVLFKRVYLCNFGGLSSIEPCGNIASIWLPISVRYEHFGGGYNGIKLFSVNIRFSTARDFAPIEVTEQIA